jgi:threonine dehydrogenase-like Zn-dependent dehydrogenase
MKAIRITAQGRAETAEVEKPALKPGHVLLKVCYAGFCGSDLNTFRGLNPLVKLPVVPGHEIGAVVAAIAGDDNCALSPGMSVTVNPYTNCGKCPACRRGRPNACEFNQTLGVQRDGAMAEYILLPIEKVIVPPAAAALAPRDLALVEPLSVGFHAVDRAGVTAADSVMILGCGMIGLGAVIRASLSGAGVIAVDVDDRKLALAARLGARHTVNSQRESLHDRIREITGVCGVDAVVEAVGRPETYLAAIAEAAYTGRVVYIGYAKEKISFDTSAFVKKELNIYGSRNALPHDFNAVMEYMSRGNCPVDELVTAVYPPEEAHAALSRWADSPGEVFRILIRFQ